MIYFPDVYYRLDRNLSTHKTCVCQLGIHAYNKYPLKRTEKHHGSTDLVHLTIGSIANHLHQLKNTCRILEKMLQDQEKDRGSKRCDAEQQVEELSQIKGTLLGRQQYM